MVHNDDNRDHGAGKLFEPGVCYQGSIFVLSLAQVPLGLQSVDVDEGKGVKRKPSDNSQTEATALNS